MQGFHDPGYTQPLPDTQDFRLFGNNTFSDVEDKIEFSLKDVEFEQLNKINEDAQLSNYIVQSDDGIVINGVLVS